ncbi:MAG: phosphodiester glycosidase family protein [Smithella sp.]
MDNSQSDKKNVLWSGPLLIARDTLIFLACVLTVTLIYFVSPKTFNSAATDQMTDSSDLNMQAQKNDDSYMPQTSAVLTASVSLATETPSPTPDPTPTPTLDTPISHGDFSATFPSSDTGINALYSYQGDTTKIAINKVQANGVTYFVADVWIKNIDAFHTALAKGTYGRGIHEMPLKIANANNAVFAVSGDYYGARELGVVVRDGAIYRDVMGEDVCILGKDGSLNIYQKSEFNSLHMLNDTVWQAWAFGPALVENGMVCDTSDSKIKVKNPRSAIGYFEPGHYCFIVVDGRQSGYSDGMTLNELANTFVSLGCVTAYNLDGGATAMMVYQGAVISQPTSGGRSSSDIIYF